MIKKLTTALIVLSTISLLGIVFTQLYWVKKAVDLKEEQFDESLRIGLKSVSNQLLELFNDSTLKKMKEQGPKCVIEKTSIKDIINSKVLDSLIQEEMRCFVLNEDYEYAVINLINDRFIMGEYNNFMEELLDSEHMVSLSSLYRPGKYVLSIYFPYQRSYIINQMIFWMVLSAFFLLVVIVTFTFTIYSFIRQKRLSEMKTDFVNNMTHEFKTPISTISLSSEMLLNKNMQGKTDRINKYAKVIYDENARLQNQVERILQIAILDKGETRIRFKEVDVHKIINKAVESFNIIIQERNGKLIPKLEADKSVIYADKVHLINIISNLLDNANKYTPETPVIKISTRNAKGGIFISVEDNGIGISRENQKHVFKKLYRVPTGNIHNVKGFGLGLFYVKAIVEAHGGFVDLQSETGKGSRFQLFLPFNTKKTNQMKKKTKILLVEDDPNLSMVLQDYLEMLDYEIFHAENGMEGMRAFKTKKFDLIILDVMMPKKDGFTMAEEIRKTNTQIPIIFLTAKSMKEDRIKGFEAGGDDYITKPFSTEELSLRIKAILKRSQVNILDNIQENEDIYELGKYEFDYKNMTLTLEEDVRTLTKKEASLLKLLCLHENKLLSREVALTTIWGENDYFIGRSMDVFIAKLRKYLADDPNIAITNVHGTGFKLEIKQN